MFYIIVAYTQTKVLDRDTENVVGVEIGANPKA